MDEDRWTTCEQCRAHVLASRLRHCRRCSRDVCGGCFALRSCGGSGDHDDTNYDEGGWCE
jgi:hypothetical protein